MRRWGRHHTGWREFSFSRRSPLSVRMRTTRIFGFKGNSYDNGIPGCIQRRTSPSSAGERLLLAYKLRPIMAGNEPSKSGGLCHASKKTQQRGNFGPTAESKRLERRERET